MTSDKCNSERNSNEHLLLLSSAGFEGLYDASERQAEGQGVGAGKVGCPGLY